MCVCAQAVESGKWVRVYLVIARDHELLYFQDEREYQAFQYISTKDADATQLALKKSQLALLQARLTHPLNPITIPFALTTADRVRVDEEGKQVVRQEGDSINLDYVFKCRSSTARRTTGFSRLVNAINKNETDYYFQLDPTPISSPHANNAEVDSDPTVIKVVTTRLQLAINLQSYYAQGHAKLVTQTALNEQDVKAHEKEEEDQGQQVVGTCEQDDDFQEDVAPSEEDEPTPGAQEDSAVTPVADEAQE